MRKWSKLLSAPVLLIATTAHDLSTATGQLPLDVAEVVRPEPVDFDREIVPLLRRNCLACHNANEAEAGLVLETRESLLKGGDSGPACVPNDPGGSLLLARATGSEEPLMPPEDNPVGAVPLTPHELGLLKLWIQQGAPSGAASGPAAIVWQPLSAFVKPIYAVATSPDGRFAAWGQGNQALVYDLATWQEAARLVDPSVGDQTGGTATDWDLVQSIAFSPDGGRIATGGFRTVKLWRRVERLPIADLSPQRDSLWENVGGMVAANADQTRLALANAIDDIEVWDVMENVRLHTFSGHADRITGLGWNASGDRLGSCDAAGKLIVWDVQKATPLVTLQARHRLVGGFALSDDGSWLAAIDSERRVVLWRIEADPASTSLPWIGTATELSAVTPIVDATAVAFVAAPERLLVVATSAGSAVLVQLESGELLRTLEHGASVATIAVRSSGGEIATAGGDGRTKLWNLASGEAIGTWEGDPRANQGALRAARDVSRQESLLAAATTRSADLTALASREAEAMAKAKETHEQTVHQLAAAEQKLVDAAAALANLEKQLADAQRATEADGTATAGAEAAPPGGSTDAAEQTSETSAKTVEQWAAELESQKKVVAEAEQAKSTSETEHANRSRAFEAAAQAAQYASAAAARGTALVELESLRLGELQRRLRGAQQRAAERSPAVSATFSPDGCWLAVAHENGIVRVDRPGKKGGSAAFDGPPGDEIALSFYSDQELCLSGVGRAPIAWTLASRWDLERTIGQADDSPLSDRVTALDFRPDGLTLAVGSGPPSRFGEVKIFAVESGQLVRDFGEVHSDAVLALRFSPDGRLLASSSADKTVRLFDVAEGRLIRSLEGHTHHVLSVDWQDDMHKLASASSDNSVKIWDATTGQALQTIVGFTNEVAAVQFVAQSVQVVTACADGQLRLYNASDGALVRSFDAGGDFLHALAVTPDGKTLVSGGQEGVVKAWSLEDGRRMERAASASPP